MLEDIYNMTQEQNIFLAKRNIVDSIWKSKLNFNNLFPR